MKEVIARMVDSQDLLVTEWALQCRRYFFQVQHKANMKCQVAFKFAANINVIYHAVGLARLWI